MIVVRCDDGESTCNITASLPDCYRAASRRLKVERSGTDYLTCLTSHAPSPPSRPFYWRL